MRKRKWFCKCREKRTENNETAQINLAKVQELITSMRATLPEKEQKVLQMYLGIDGEPMRYDEIAEKMHVSRARIGQIYNKALERLRNHDLARELKTEYLDR